MSSFLDSICTIITVFHKHAKEDGDCTKLSRRKMKEFIQSEFADVIAKPHDPQTIDKILWFLEWDSDGEIDFNEFLALVCRVAKACYWYLPSGPCLLQRTKLTTSKLTLQEPEINDRGSRQHLREEEQQTHERNHHSSSERELQRDTRVNTLETIEERRKHQQQRNETKQSIIEKHRGQTQETEKRGATTDLRDTRERREVETRESQDDGRRRESMRYERSQETAVVEAEADVKIRRVSREVEPRGDVEWRDRCCEREELEDERRISQGRDRKEPVQDRAITHQRELDLQVTECRRGQTHEREERGATTDQRDTRERREVETRELEYDGRRRESVRYERSQETAVAEAEADVKFRRVSREVEPRGDVEWRDRCCGWEELEDERRISQGRERKEPVQDRALPHHHELDLQRKEPVQDRAIPRHHEPDLQVTECRRGQTHEREKRGATTDQRDTRERRDVETRESQDDGRRRESVRYERSQETVEAAAEADVKIRRVSREVEPRGDVEWRDRCCEREEPEDERRISQGRDRQEPVQDRAITHQRELDLDIIEHRRHQTHEREEQRDIRSHRDARERSSLQTVEEDEETDLIYHP
ncbi:RPTN protein, partial [Centropus bengalensis]|nr:RPTN protein [Centropus bengalensis]